MNISILDEQKRHQVQCFHCGEFFMVCRCTNHPHGDGYQFMFNDADLPSTNSSIEDNVQFWGALIKAGQLTMKFNYDLFYREQYLNRDGPTMIRDEDLKRQFYDCWDKYTKTSHFNDVLAKAFPLISVAQLKTAGIEAWNSFFSGRWWELCRFSVMFVMNSLETCGPNPHAPSTAQMRVIADLMQMVEVVLNIGCPSSHNYSLVAPERVSDMSKLALFQRVPIPADKVEAVKEKKISEGDDDSDEDADSGTEENGPVDAIAVGVFHPNKKSKRNKKKKGKKTSGKK